MPKVSGSSPMYRAVSWQPLVRAIAGASSMAFLCFGFPAEVQR